MFRIISILLYIAVFSCAPLFAQTTNDDLAPGAPGKDAQWLSAGKQGVGTSNTLESKVWFTLQGGVMTEVYYPDVTVANVQKLELIIVDNEKVETESENTIHSVKVTDSSSLSFTQINTAKSKRYRITKTYISDPQNNVVLIDVKFEPMVKGRFVLYVYYDPSLNNSGFHDTAWTEDGALLSSDSDKCSALVYSSLDKQAERFQETTNGFLGVSDGLFLLKGKKELSEGYNRAENGNVVQVARIPYRFKGEIYEQALGFESTSEHQFRLALGFGKDAREALKEARQTLFKGFKNTQSEYNSGWQTYVKTIRKVKKKYQAQCNMAAMILRAHEDKIHRGANIASLSVPWGGGSNANEANVGGYHLVWSRDLYQVATAYMALGDKAAAERALNFLFKVQQKEDGSFPQNSWLDGKPFWGSLQLDEVAFPLILAYQLGRNDKESFTMHIKPAADFIVKNGPATPQERWEEEAGYSPSTIAAEIAGLVCAAEIAKHNNDEASAEVYLLTADEWASNIEKWTATTNGKYGDGNYYLRITQKGTPNSGDKIELNNGAGSFDEREIIDAGFLELVRLGIKSPDDPLIQKSIKVIDQVIKVKTPNGEAFYRYNNDGYGEMDDGRSWNFDGNYTGKGKLWALLSGERGQYEIADCRLQIAELKTKGERPKSEVKNNQCLAKAKLRLDAMLGFANEGLMIPEQVWERRQSFRSDLRFGEGTGSATPLAWSMAQFIRLVINIREGKNLDTPTVVADRYLKLKKRKS